MLVVQRTGWGKSAVYFVATRLLRDAGAGPTLLVSPLLALMRNQIDAGRARRRVDAARSTATTATQWDDDRRRARRRHRSTCCSSRPSGSPTRRSATTVLPDARAARRPARHRRGALHQRLGPRLPARLPPHRPRPRSPARAACRCSAPPRPPTTASSPTSQAQLGDELAHHPRPARPREPRARRDRSCRSQAERLAWLAQVHPDAARHRHRLLPHRRRRRTASPSGCASQGIAAARLHRRDRHRAARSCSRPTCSANEIKARRRHLGARHGLRQARPRVRRSTTSRRARRSPTTSRSAGPGARIDRRRTASCSRGHEDRDIQDYFIRTAFPRPGAGRGRRRPARRRAPTGCRFAEIEDARERPAQPARQRC